MEKITQKNAVPTKPIFINLALISSLLAIAVHAYLTQHYYGLIVGSSAGDAICNLGGRFNCDAVTASSYASAFNIPIALFGAITNLVLFLLLLVAKLKMSTDVDLIKRYAAQLATLVAATSVVMGSISSFVLGSFCLFCVAAYLLSFIGAFSALKANSESPFKKLSHDLKMLVTGFKWVGIMLILIPVASLLTHKMMLDTYGLSKMNEFTKDAVQSWKLSTQQSFDAEMGLSVGPVDAKMVIVEFADFLCPHCKFAAPSIKAFYQSNPKDVRIVFKAFPLDGYCNPAQGLSTGDGVRCMLTAATYCAESEAQMGWAMHDFIFANQEKFRGPSDSENRLKTFSEQKGLNWENMKVCMDSAETQEKIRSISNEGVVANIRGTPTVFVNRKLVKMGQSVAILKKVLEEIKK